MTRLSDHQAHAASMQSLARPVTEVPCVLIVRLRLEQLDEVFWGRGWDEFASAAWEIWEVGRAALLGMLVVEDGK